MKKFNKTDLDAKKIKKKSNAYKRNSRDKAKTHKNASNLVKYSKKRLFFILKSVFNVNNNLHIKISKNSFLIT